MNEEGNQRTVRLVIVRHGETWWNRLCKLQGHSDTELSDLGLLQAQKTAIALKDFRFGLAVASDLVRAKKTAEVILGGLSMDEQIQPALLLRPALREISLGIFEGLTVNEIRQEPELFESWQSFHTDWSKKAPNGESKMEFSGRVLEAFENVVKDVALIPQAEKIGLLVCHGGFISQLLRSITKDRTHPQNCSITTVHAKVSEDGRKVLSCHFDRINDVEHLQKETESIIL